MSRRVDIDVIKEYVASEHFEFYRHALTEAKKDGIEPEDVVYVLLTGKIIEAYPERERVLVYGKTKQDLPVHVVCDLSDEDLMYVPTVYIPSSSDWIRSQIRRRQQRKER